MVKDKIDPRGEYYWSRVKKHGARYRGFHWPSVEILLNLIYTYDILSGHLEEKIGPHKITRAGFSVLMILSRSQSKACKQNEISRLMLVSRANITGLVDGLVRLGLVERRQDPHDRRVKMVKIMPRGENLLKNLLPEYYKHVYEICSVFSVKEKKMFNDFLARLREKTTQVRDKDQ